tara:strand:- start:1465 stop:1851 length:387 start_codon:yes stop_codon:yes gene_type:complete
MEPKQDADNIWQKSETPGVMPQAEYTIAGEVQAAQEIPLGATHYAMFPQTNAVTALVLAILSFAGCGIITSIPALFFALSAKKITDQNPMHPDRGVATAAYITAIINIVISTLIILFYLGIFAIYMLS